MISERLARGSQLVISVRCTCRRLWRAADLAPLFSTELCIRVINNTICSRARARETLRRLLFLPEDRPGIVQVEAEGNPPNQVVGHAENPRPNWPDPAPNEAR
jgi:hypothetical protein